MHLHHHSTHLTKKVFSDSAESQLSNMVLQAPATRLSVLKERHLRLLFRVGNSQKSQDTRSELFGGWGITSILYFLRNACINSAAWGNTLSWWRTIFCETSTITVICHRLSELSSSSKHPIVFTIVSVEAVTHLPVDSHSALSTHSALNIQRHVKTAL